MAVMDTAAGHIPLYMGTDHGSSVAVEGPEIAVRVHAPGEVIEAVGDAPDAAHKLLTSHGGPRVLAEMIAEMIECRGLAGTCTQARVAEALTYWAPKLVVPEDCAVIVRTTEDEVWAVGPGWVAASHAGIGISWNSDETFEAVPGRRMASLETEADGGRLLRLSRGAVMDVVRLPKLWK